MPYPVSNFVSNGRGENHHAICNPGMPVNSEVAIDGVTDLSSIVQFNDGGRVYFITLTWSPGIYSYVISVDGRGPSGFGSGSGYLAFTDMTGDTYNLSLYNSSRAVHTVRFNSDNPAIKAIQWSNTSIGVASSNQGSIEEGKPTT